MELHDIEEQIYNIQDESNEKKKTSLFDKIKPDLIRTKKFYSQLGVLMSKTQPNESSLSYKIEKTCQKIKKIHEKLFPNCEAIPFGSSTTELAFIDSDLDIYLSTNVPIDDDYCEKTTISNNNEKIWTQKLLFREIKNNLYKNKYIIKNIVPISTALTPIIKFHFIPTDIDVDLTFKNSLGVYKSKLIKFCINLDSRIIPLIMIIKFWGKELNLTGKRKLSNYFILMMIFYYLQQPNISLIPKINILQSNCNPIIYQGWQINFNEYYEKTTLNCDKTLSQLLGDFFKFYLKFDFTSRVICPLDGTAPLRDDFIKSSLGQKYNFIFTGLIDSACLHDPIKLDYVIKGWSSIRLQHFINACRQTHELCQFDDAHLDLSILFDKTLYNNISSPPPPPQHNN